jgi:uncharacterized protein (TIGR03546 family)
MLSDWLKKIKQIFFKALRLNNTPHEIALGVSIGVFIAILPLYGLHTLLVVIFAMMIPHANKIAILLGTNISLPPTVPFITWVGYEIGRFFLNKSYPPFNLAYFTKINFQIIKDLYLPLFIGSFILGIISAIIFYFIALFIVKKIQAKKEEL